MRRKPVISALIASFFIAIMVWLLVKQVESFEADVFQRLITAFATEEPGKITGTSALNVDLINKIATAAGFLLFASASTWAGFKLAPFARIIVGIQLFVMSLFYQWALWQWMALAGHPVGYSAAILIGCLAGGALRQLELARRESESRYYELKIRNKELQETRLSLVKQDEVERRMLAADLHDQVLNDMKQLVQRFEDYVANADQEALTKCRDLSGKVMHEIREVMDSLCPSVLEHLGLVAAIEDAVRKGGERSGFKVRFRGKIDSDELRGLSIVEQSLVYRLVQESITNICKHANASTVRATVDKVDECLLITINDDGKGLDPAKQRNDSRGLKYMRLRADLIGATIAWKQGENDKGTKVEIRLDLTGRQAVQTDD